MSPPPCCLDQIFISRVDGSTARANPVAVELPARPAAAHLAHCVPVTTGLRPGCLGVNALSVSTPTGMAPSPLALAVSLAFCSVPACSWRSVTAHSWCSNTAG